MSVQFQIHTWRKWEDEARTDQHDVYSGKILFCLNYLVKKDLKERPTDIACNMTTESKKRKNIAKHFF